MTAVELTISRKTIGVWRVELPDGNWLAHLFHDRGVKLKPGRPTWTAWGGVPARRGYFVPRHIQLAYRFHWYKKPTLARSWAICLIRPGTSDVKAIERARELHDRVMVDGISGWEFLRRGRSVTDFYAALRKMPGMTTAAGAETIRLVERPPTPCSD